jgi:hypothetical protein
MNDLLRRKVATEKTLERFRNKAFDFSGSSCIHLARFQARNMGHVVPAMPFIRSAKSALTALRRLGHASTIDLVDGVFPRIAPAMMLLGDLAAVPGDESDGDPMTLCGIGIADGVGNLFGWHPDDLSRLLPVKFATADIMAAWRL